MIFLHQLSYIVGQDVFDRGMKRYFNEWKYKHPTPNDFIRVMEKVSGMELNWYLEQWVETTNTIDYSIKWMQEKEGKTAVLLEKIGRMPMPVDVKVTYNSGKEEWFSIPLTIMRGEKNAEKGMDNFEVRTDWPWVYPTYELQLNAPVSSISTIEIDPSGRLADIDRENNKYPRSEDTTFKIK